MNGDTGNNYSQHYLWGNANTSVGSGNNATASSINCGGISYGISATNPRAFIVDLLDYTDTNKNKVVKILTGEDENGAGEVTFQSGVWRNSAAVTSLTVVMQNDFTNGSKIALYGVL